jgi:hypothetical protein
VGVNAVYPKEFLNGTLRMGATVKNLGSGLKYLQSNDPFPTEVRVGISALELLNRKLNLSMDYGKARDNKAAPYFGAEYWLGSIIALRAGYAGTSDESNGLRAGIGIKVKDFSFDYAYSPYGDLGMTNRYELTCRFGAVRPLLSPEERAILRRGKQALREGRYDESVMLFNSLVELEPTYKPVRKLIKEAMRNYEVQDKLAKKSGEFHYKQADRNILRSPQDTSNDDLEQLLMLGNSDTQQATKKESKLVNVGISQ